MKSFLPIGSVVLLHGGTKRVMICGRVQVQVDDKKLFDYVACLYPEGYIDAQSMYLFNNEDIDKVYYVGMQDAEEFAFREVMDEELEKLEQSLSETDK